LNITDILIKKEDSDTNTHTVERPCEDTERRQARRKASEKNKYLLTT
jgi:hypothetical protein